MTVTHSSYDPSAMVDKNTPNHYCDDPSAKAGDQADLKATVLSQTHHPAPVVDFEW